MSGADAQGASSAIDEEDQNAQDPLKLNNDVCHSWRIPHAVYRPEISKLSSHDAPRVAGGRGGTAEARAQEVVRLSRASLCLLHKAEAAYAQVALTFACARRLRGVGRDWAAQLAVGAVQQKSLSTLAPAR
jgi:hypothetical protein